MTRIILEVWRGGRWIVIGKWSITTRLSIETIAETICPKDRSIASVKVDKQGVGLIRLF